MPIAEIILEIDAYLSRLRQARELLSDGNAEQPKTKTPRGKRKILASQTKPANSIRRRADKSKSRSSQRVADLKNVSERLDPTAQLPIALALDSSHREPPALAEPERIAEPSVVVTRLPARRRRTSIGSELHRTAKPAQRIKPDAIRPAIALAGPTNTKVVVVSAEQARQQREQGSHPAVRLPRLPASGLSGRMAFEALFKDEPEASKSSGQ
jgi:hypothetical protein